MACDRNPVAKCAAESDRGEKKSSPLDVIHKPRESLLSSSEPTTNYKGLVSFCVVIVVLSHSISVLDNVLRYGILVDPIRWVRYIQHDPAIWPPLYLLMGLNVNILCSLIVEKLLAQDNAWQGVGRSALCFNLSLTLAAPCLVVFVWECNPVAAGMVMCLVTMTFLKLVSYHMVNFWCRQQKASPKNHERCISLEGETTPAMPANGICTDGPRRNVLVYPDNLRIDNVYFFMVAPTLCYELNFPRSSAIRKTFLFRRFLESLLLLPLIMALVEQLMIPLVQPTAKPAEMAGSCPAELSVSIGQEERRIPTALEQFLKAAVTNIFIWLVIFYWFFHSTLNMTAEALRFADREFYRDWWNAETVQYFWQNWNVPVYHWCLRHLYRPLLGTGMSRFSACSFVFLISAFFHEFVLSVPLRVFRAWAFTGMLLQIPWTLLIDKWLCNWFPRLAGMAVWTAFIATLALSNIPYYREYYLVLAGTIAQSP